MIRINLVLVIILFAITGCGEKKQADNDDFVTVDVTKIYSSKKELT